MKLRVLLVTAALVLSGCGSYGSPDGEEASSAIETSTTVTLSIGN